MERADQLIFNLKMKKAGQISKLSGFYFILARINTKKSAAAERRKKKAKGETMNNELKFRLPPFAFIVSFIRLKPAFSGENLRFHFLSSPPLKLPANSFRFKTHLLFCNIGL
jgi:hypothetical protein